jgi:hypothetical protein
VDVEICPECGASIGEGIVVQSTDAAVYPELAKANLLRMRGEYRLAEEQCLSILKRYPNNASANILLGDICADRGDWDQAEQWYEMALDLDHDSEATKEKLETVRQRLKRLEVTEVVEQLGLPDRPSKTGIYAAAALAAIVIGGLIVYAVTSATPSTSKPEALTPLQVQPNTPAASRSDPPATAPAATNTATPNTTEGSEMGPFQRLVASNPDAGRLLNVFQDPRTLHVTAIFRIEQGDDARMLAARLGRLAIERFTGAPAATMRGMQNSALVYVADVTRSRVDEIAGQAWQTQNQNQPDAWMSYVLSGEWIAQGFSPSPTAPAPQPGGPDSDAANVPGTNLSTGSTG